MYYMFELVNQVYYTISRRYDVYFCSIDGLACLRKDKIANDGKSTVCSTECRTKTLNPIGIEHNLI